MELTSLAAPQALQSMLLAAIAFTDAMMLGQVGEQQVAAAGLAARASFMLFLVTQGIGKAGSVIAVQLWGAHDVEGFKRTLGMTSAACFVSGLVSTAALAVLAGPIMALGSNDPGVVQLGSSYLRVMSFAALGTGLLVPIEDALRILGKTAVPLLGSLLEGALGLTLNYMLIFGEAGLPQLGLQGAAYGSLTARCVRVLLVVGYTWLREPRARFSRGGVTVFGNARSGEFMRLVLPLTSANFVWALGLFTLQLIYGRMGVAELATMTVVANIHRLVGCLIFGVANATAIIVGKTIGAGETELAQKRVYWGLATSASCTAAACCLLFLGKSRILPAFSAFDEPTMRLASGVYALMLIDLLLSAANVVIIEGGLKAGGDARYCLILNVLTAWAVAIPVSALAALQWNWALPAVYALAMTEEGVKVVLGLQRLRQRGWLRNLDVRSPATRPAAAA